MMLQNHKFLTLLLCFLSLSLFAQKPDKNSPVFNKVQKASQKMASPHFSLLKVSKTDFATAGIQKSMLKAGILLDIDQEAISQLQKQNPDALQLSLPMPEKSNVTLSLVRNKVLTPDFILRQSSNTDQIVDYTPGLYYTGVIENDPGSLVSISVFNNEIIGTIHTPEGNYVIGKLNAQNSKQHIIYNDTDLANPMTLDCSTEDDGLVYSNKDLSFDMSKAVGDCVRVYIEIDDDIVTDKGGVTGATNYITGVMNEVITLYANDNLTMAISEILAWDTPAPYSGSSSSAMLSSYQANTGAFNGDLSHLVSYQASGGIAAGFSGICNPNVDNSKCFSSIGSSYAQVPTYSYTVMVMTHEMGHLIGSRHTHACVWNGNGTAIDGCAGFTEGSCPVPGSPPGGGTIMSYCHLTTGIDFTQGFGPQPQAVLLNTIANATCLSACSGPTCDDGVQNGDETGVDCGGSTCPPCETNCDDNDVYVNLLFDNYPEETSWNVTDAGGAVVASGGTYPSQPDGSALTITLCLVDGCYDFTIFDSYGDGMCCGYGNGSYSVTDGSGNVLASGGQFGSSETTNFCFGGSPLTVSATATDVTCFGGNDGTATATAAGGTGSYSYIWSNGSTSASISGLVAGTYTVTVDDGTSTASTSVDVLDGAATTYYADTDGDGFGDPNNSTQGGCTPPAGYVTDNTDCNDNNAAIYPNAPEVCDGLDNNCNGQIDEGLLNTYYADTDGDGFGDPNNSTTACTAPAGYVTDNTDCDDSNANIYIGASCDDGNPNTANDVYDSNCVCVGTPTGGCQDNEVVFTLVLDNWPQEVSWELSNSSGAVVYAGGTYPGQAGATVMETFCLPDDCYDFTMFDSYGDGICCAYGNGSYELVDDSGNVLASGGAYGSSETTNFCLPLALPYCDAAGTNTNYEWIESASIGNVANTSGNDNGYGDYTSLTVNAAPGENVVFTLTPGFNNATGYTENFVIWVDYNRDSDFDDAGEEVYSGSNNGAVSGSFTIPADASQSPTRIRVAMHWGGFPASCGSFTYGEVEDYTLLVSGVPPANAEVPTGSHTANSRSKEATVWSTSSSIQIYPNPATELVTIEAELRSATPAQLIISDVKGSSMLDMSNVSISGTTLQERIDISQYPEGIYFVRILSGEEIITQRFVKTK